jgi:CPA2 family monovalent cation:H+ antiporter-2
MGHELLLLGAAFLVAGLLARLGRGIGLPTIPVFVAAGILVGPHTAGPVLFDHPGDLTLLADLGLVFLLFSLGVELSLDELTKGGSRLLASAAVYLGLNVGGGIALGFGIGWGPKEALVIAGATGISSSAIVTKILIDTRRLDSEETPVILGIIVIEDVFLALYLAALAPVLGEADSAGSSLLLFGRALGFLVVLALVARFGAPVIGRVITDRTDELLIVLFVGFALLVAGVAEELGVSDAIGAFMAGLVLSSTVAAARIRHLVVPLRDAFGAVFFFAFGLAIDPAAISSVLAPAAIAVAVSLALAVVAGLTVARINGFDRRQVMRISTTLVSRGEFSLILVTLAVGAGLDPRLSPLIGVYVLVLAVLSPVLAEHGDRLFHRSSTDSSTPDGESEPEDVPHLARRGERSGPGSP